MLVGSDVYCVVNPVDNVAAVARQQRSNVDVPLLQFLMRIQLIKCSLQLSLGRFVPRHLRAMKAEYAILQADS